jgi:hypothetical protein
MDSWLMDWNVFSQRAAMSFDWVSGLDLVPGKEPRRDYAVRLIVSDSISLDGVVQAPGEPGEDTDGAFAHGGWSMPYFGPDAMGAGDRRHHGRQEALLFGRHRTVAPNRLVAPAVLTMLASRSWAQGMPR